MSFDLFFCSRQPKRIDFEAVAKRAEKIGNFTRNGTEFFYQNPDTGVYFSIYYDAMPPDDPEDSPVPAGCNDTGFSFNLNYNRPSFFAYEAMPVVARLVQDFSLGVYNPQADENAQAIRYSVDSESLLNSWLDHNRRATSALSESQAAHSEHMPRAKSLRMWRYMSQKRDLQQRLAAEDDIFVPKMVPVQHKGARKLELAFVCSDEVHCLVPAVDWVLIVRSKKGLFKSKGDREVGIISYTTFLELMGHLVQPFEENVEQIKLESAEEMMKIIRRFDLPDNRGDFKLAEMDSFIDSEIAEAASS